MTEKFYINEYGEVVRKDNFNVDETDEQKLMKEYSLLCYEIYHLTRPTKDTKKIARYEELKRILEIDEDKQNQAFIKAKQNELDKIKDKEQPDNLVLKMAMMKLRKENQ